jgi:phosphomannomutase
MLAVDAHGEIVDGDVVAICALALEVDVVAVTVMTNLAYRLMEDHGAVLTTDVGDRYVLEALRRQCVLGGEQSDT